jgi:hypothetical protein
MTTLETVALCYDAWQNKHGAFSEVPLAADDRREGPLGVAAPAERVTTGWRQLVYDQVVRVLDHVADGVVG